MNRNVMIVLAGGFLIAILVALLVQASLSGSKKKEEPVVVKEVAKVKIIVARKDLKIGAQLTDENMKWQEWPESAVFPGAVVREDDKKASEMLSGKLVRAVQSGEPILENAVLVGGQTNYVAASLSEGKRAFSIKISATTGVSGFVMPGDFVDIMLTYNKSIRYRGEDQDMVQNQIELNIDDNATETILQNIKVLAVDQRPTKGEEDKVKVGKTATLEVTPKQAEILAVASKTGTLSFSLRGLGDDQIVKREGPITTDARITNVYKEVLEEVINSPVDSTGQISQIVRIYRGDQVQDLSVGR